MYHPTRGGVRGGTDQFSWDAVKTDKHRENYLGHSLMAPVGRWQKGKDLSWYAKERKGGESVERSNKAKELAAIKRSEEEAMLIALGLKTAEKTAQTLGKEEIAEVLKTSSESRGSLSVERIQGVGIESGRAAMLVGDGKNRSGPGISFESRSQEKLKDGQQLNKETSDSARHSEVPHKASKKSKKEKKHKKKKKKKQKHREQNSEPDSEEDAKIASHKMKLSHRHQTAVIHNHEKHKTHNRSTGWDTSSKDFHSKKSAHKYEKHGDCRRTHTQSNSQSSSTRKHRHDTPSSSSSSCSDSEAQRKGDPELESKVMKYHKSTSKERKKRKRKQSSSNSDTDSYHNVKSSLKKDSKTNLKYETNERDHRPSKRKRHDTSESE